MSGKHTQRNHQPFKPAFCLRRRNAQGACTGIRHALPSPIPPPNAPLRRSTSADYHLQVLLVDPPLARLPDLDRAWSGVRFVQHCLYPNHALFRFLFPTFSFFVFRFSRRVSFFFRLFFIYFFVFSFFFRVFCLFFNVFVDDRARTSNSDSKSGVHGSNNGSVKGRRRSESAAAIWQTGRTGSAG